MRSGHGVKKTDQPALDRERSLVARTSAAPAEPAAADLLPREEDDHFAWFVNLFVAEYASEGVVAPDDRSARAPAAVASRHRI